MPYDSWSELFLLNIQMNLQLCQVVFHHATIYPCGECIPFGILQPTLPYGLTVALALVWVLNFSFHFSVIKNATSKMFYIKLESMEL